MACVIPSFVKKQRLQNFLAQEFHRVRKAQGLRYKSHRLIDQQMGGMMGILLAHLQIGRQIVNTRLIDRWTDMLINKEQNDRKLGREIVLTYMHTAVHTAVRTAFGLLGPYKSSWSHGLRLMPWNPPSPFRVHGNNHVWTRGSLKRGKPWTYKGTWPSPKGRGIMPTASRAKFYSCSRLSIVPVYQAQTLVVGSKENVSCHPHESSMLICANPCGA